MRKLLIFSLALSIATVFGGLFSEEEDKKQLNAYIDSLLDLSDEQNKPECPNNCLTLRDGNCLSSFEIFVQTAGKKWSGSGGPHGIYIVFKGGRNKTISLSGLPKENQAKLYRFTAEQAGLDVECVSIFDINKIAMTAQSKDAWLIDTIITVFADGKGRTFTGSIDRENTQWLDHQDKPEYESFGLTLGGHN